MRAKRTHLGIYSSWLAAALVLAACGSSPDPADERESPSPSPAADSDLAAQARDAYIFSYPLVMNYRTMYRQAIEGDHEFGTWLHLGQSSPADIDIVTPNNDTPYSYAWVDLRAEPWVLTMPPIEADRYYDSQWDDLWGFVLDNPGSVEDGNDGTTVLLTAPGWDGDPPAGVDRTITGESDLLGTLTRTQLLSDQGGIDRVEQIQQEYRLEPLSSFAGTAAPAPAPQVDWPTWEEGAENTEKFWDYVAFLLPFTTHNPVDQPMYDALADLGISRDAPFDPATLSPAARAALTSGVSDGQAELKRLSEAKDVDSSALFGDRAAMGTDYVNRALGVYMGIFGNVGKQAIYYTLPADSAGQPLDGSKASYTITFPPGGQPPVDYFWSLTMYGMPDRFLVANPIDRYSIGSPTPGLVENPDGSLTIHFAATDPGGEQTHNWLPAPEGPFWVVLRTYGPQPPILDRSWPLPSVDAVS